MKCCFDSQFELPEFVDTVAQKCTNPGCKFFHLLTNYY